MKKNISLIFGILLIFSSCQFKQSIGKNLNTGASYRGDGIITDNIILQINGKEENRNEFIYGEEVNIVFEDVSGFKQVDNKIFPQMSLYILQNEHDTISVQQNLLEDADDGIEVSPLQLTTSFLAILPYRSNEKYKAVVRISDRKSDRKFTYTLPFSIQPNKFFKIENSGLKYKSIYLWDDELKKVVVDNHLLAGRKYLLVFEKIEGFKVSEAKVFPDFSVKITDKDRQVVLERSDLLGEIKEIGINPEEFIKNQLAAVIVIPKEKINNPYKLTARLKDLISAKELKVEMDFILEEE